VVDKWPASLLNMNRELQLINVKHNIYIYIYIYMMSSEIYDAMSSGELAYTLLCVSNETQNLD
jgi:hypothetical protein